MNATNTPPNPSNPFVALTQQVRARTLYLLRKADPSALTWTPPGTANHLLWHAGHALWVQDALCVEPLSGNSQLPPDWPRRFGMHSQPALDPNPWPTRESLLDLLTAQLQTLETLLTAADPAILAQTNPPGPADPGLAWAILHGLHDEAIHQGEMHLLLKLWKTHYPPHPPLPPQNP